MSGDNKRKFKSRAEYDAYVEAKRKRQEQLNDPTFQPPANYQAPDIPNKPASEPIKPKQVITYQKPVYHQPVERTPYQPPVNSAPPTPITHQQFQRPQPQPQIIYQQPYPAQTHRNLENTPGIEFHGQPKLKIGGMKFRRAFFWFMALLMLCQMCYVVTTIFSVAGDNLSGQQSYDPYTNPANTVGFMQDLTVLGLTGIASYVVVLCSGMMFFAFALLAWRNGAGIRQARLNHKQLMMMYQTRYSVYNPSYDRDDPYGY